jgi:hypothetical protein
MKNTILIIALLICGLNSLGQSILKDKTKFQVKTISTGGYEAVLPLKCGDDETIKNTPIVIFTQQIEKSKIDTMLLVSTFQVLNVMSKYKCKNKFSWKPTKFTILGNEGKISAIVKGSAENAYGSRGEVTFYFNWENGEFVEL